MKKRKKLLPFVKMDDRKAQKEQGFFDGRFTPKVIPNKKKQQELKTKHKKKISSDD